MEFGDKCRDYFIHGALGPTIGAGPKILAWAGTRTLANLGPGPMHIGISELVTNSISYCYVCVYIRVFVNKTEELRQLL